MLRSCGPALFLILGACSAGQGPAAENEISRVDASGKVPVPVEQLPAAVREAVKARAPDLQITEADTETRNSVRYYDVGGVLTDGSEMELDVVADGTGWRVVETQRDMAFADVPPQVRSVAMEQDPKLKPTRVIESRQEDGVIIYELYSAKGPSSQGQKTEVRWDGRKAQALTSEWVH